jgi:hypothetical protein
MWRVGSLYTGTVDFCRDAFLIVFGVGYCKVAVAVQNYWL